MQVPRVALVLREKWFDAVLRGYILHKAIVRYEDMGLLLRYGRRRDFQNVMPIEMFLLRLDPVWPGEVKRFEDPASDRVWLVVREEDLESAMEQGGRVEGYMPLAPGGAYMCVEVPRHPMQIPRSD